MRTLRRIRRKTAIQCLLLCAGPVEKNGFLKTRSNSAPTAANLRPNTLCLLKREAAQPMTKREGPVRKAPNDTKRKAETRSRIVVN